MKRFSRLLLITSLAIACLPLKRVIAAPLLIQPVSTEASAQTMQLATLPREELCQYQNMSGAGRRYGHANWCWEQKDRDKKQQIKKEQDKKEWNRKAWEKDRQNKEYWDKKTQEREYFNKQYWDRKYWDKKQRDREYWERRERARGR